MAERNTAQKSAIWEVLSGSEAPLSVEEILVRAQQVVPTLSQATVYRVLKRFCDRGEVETVQLPGENPLYEPAGKGHHHWFRCRRCKRMTEITGCDALIDQLAPPGFVLEDHDVFLFGVCATCRKR